MQNAKFHDSEKEKLISGADVITKLEKNSERLPLEVAYAKFCLNEISTF